MQMAGKSERFSWFVRLGYAARGVVYLLLGYLALTTASEAKGGGDAVFDMLQNVPLGTPLLWVMAVGLLAYGVYKLLAGIADIENRGRDAKGAIERVGDCASGVAHGFLAYAAYQFATGAQRSAGGSQEQAGTVLQWELGGIVIGLIGLGFILGAAKQAKSAIDAHFMHRVSPRAPTWVEPVGRAGHAARGVVFVIIGWSLIQSAWFSSQSQVKGLGEAIMSLRDMGLLYTLVAIGLLLFGVFGLAVARYRIIPDLGPQGIKPSFR
jgi:hypothetical protein